MVRTVTQNYGVWLAGYYDDFTGARAVPEDTNVPTVGGTYEQSNTHFGNPMNGEATLNPRYRWSFVDRKRSIGSAFVSTTDNKLLSNKGVFEWVTHDTTRQDSNKWEGRAQLQYPDGNIPNTYKYANSGSTGITDFYQLISCSFDTSKHYSIATGDNDSTFGRANMKSYTESNFENTYSTAGQMASSAGNFIQRAHLAGCWMGEQIRNAEGSADWAHTGAYNTFPTVTSPAKTPFLCIQSYHTQHDSAGSRVAICYNGSLNSRLNEDIFTIRLAVRTMSVTEAGNDMMGKITPRITLELGGASSSVSTKMNGFGSPAISYTLDLSSYNTNPKKYQWGSSYASSTTLATSDVDNDSFWIDVDVVLDYDNNQYKVYQDGVLKQTTSSFTITPEQLFGWQLKALPTASYTKPSIITVMVDRAALYHPLTDHVDGREIAPIQKLDMKNVQNGYSQLSMEVYDDKTDDNGSSITDYSHQFKNIFMSSTLADWKMLCFMNEMGSARIDRPLWQGFIDKINISQTLKGGRAAKIECSDYISKMNKTLPMWEIGQDSLDDDEDGTAYWLYDAKGFADAMNMGVRELEDLKPTVGFDVDDNYTELLEQRTQLGSSHPIQMYINEDDFGPNNIEDAYDGVAILGFDKKWDSGNKLLVTLKGTGHWSSGSITIGNAGKSGHNITATPDSSSDVNGNQVLLFASSVFTSGNANNTGAGAIVYAGKYKPHIIDYTYTNTLSPTIRSHIRDIHPTTPHNETDKLHLIFDADPKLVAGDTFMIAKQKSSISNTSGVDYLHDVRHQVVSCVNTWNYFGTGYTPSDPTANPLWVVETTTDYGGTEYGNYTGSDLMSNSGESLDWSNDTGQVVTQSPLSSSMKHRAIHARWIRDLADSLWFRYHFGQVYGKADSCSLESALAKDSQVVKISSTGDNDVYTNASSKGGLAQIYHINYGYTTFIYKGKYSNGNNRYLVGCKFISKAYPVSELRGGYGGVNINTEVKLADTKVDYKHIWVLWSDMRNNGKADADGDSRKEDFGLIYPTSHNYNIKLRYADQIDKDGNYDNFATLKSESDYLIWNIDSTNDPSTGGAFSKPADYANSVTSGITFAEDSTGNTKLKVTKTSHGLSANAYVHIYNSTLHNGHYQIESVTTNTFTLKAGTWKGSDTGATGGVRYAPATGSEADLTQYHDWEDKAGAFVIIDTSPFFNLNTMANGARAGSEVGLKTDLEDYVATVSGFPMLIDNYYLEAMSGFKTTASPFEHHPNDRRLNIEATLATKNLEKNTSYIKGQDFSKFPSSGFGRITGVKGEGTNKQIAERFFWWGAKIGTEISKTITSSADITYYGDHNYGSGKVVGKRITVSGINFGTLGVEIGSLLEHDGVKYTVTKIATVSSTNDSVYINKVLTDKELRDEFTDSDAFVFWVDEDNATFGYPVAVSGEQSIASHECFTDISTVTFNSTAFSIPPQLNYVWTTSLNNLTASTLDSPSAVEAELGLLLANLPVSERRIDIGMGIEGETPQFDTITINSGVSSQYMLRLMMKLEGYVKSSNTGTFYQSDKFRMLWNSALVDNWMPPTSMPCIFDINNIPLTTIMTTDGSASNSDNFGSTLDARGSSIGQILNNLKDASSVGVNGTVINFSYLQGRDGRIDFRPKYNSGIAFTRDNMVISSMDMDIATQVDRVRVYYDNASSFVDYPEDPSPYTSTSKWEIVEEPNIKQNHEALAFAKSQYEKLKTPKLALKITPSLDRLDHEPMLSGGRYGYVSDPQVALQGRLDIDEDSGTQPANRHHAWTFLGTGGIPYSGMVNALDGNQQTTTDIYSRYGVSEQKTTSADTAWNDNYYWYGANSLSNALQCVHVPKRCPFVSETTGEELRLFVSLKTGQTASNPATEDEIDASQFTIGIMDYEFSGSAGTGAGGSTLAHSLPAGSGTKYTTLDVKENGFYEILIPESYSESLHDAGAKIVFSFNADYCRSLLRHRCGDPTNTNILRNAHNIVGLTAFGSPFNTDSIFPLGLREQDIHPAGFSGTRVGYYAPRLQIVPDLTYVPSTFVTVTDAGLNLSSEVLAIKQTMYKIDTKSIKVDLLLEKDESKSADSVISYLFPTPAPPPPVEFFSFSNSLGPSGTAEAGVNPNAANNQPSGSGVPTNSQSQGTPPASSSSSVGINYIDTDAYGNLTGRMGLTADQFTGQGEFSLLGQNAVGRTPSVMRGSNEFSDLSIKGGSAVRSDEGWSLPPTGNNPDEEVTIFHEGKVSRVVSVPSDATTEEISVNALLSLGDGVASSGVAKVLVKIECLDTGSKYTRNVTISPNTIRKNISLISNTNLSGASTPSNRIKVTLSRRDNSYDTSDDSLMIHNLDVQFRRAGMQSKAGTHTFRPYQ